MEKKNPKLDKKKTGKKSAKVKVVSKKTGKKSDNKKIITEVKAKARYIKISPRKVRLITSQMRGLNVQEAIDLLRFTNKAAVNPITKLLKSAIANAENNFSLNKDYLYIKEIIANDGPILKRWKPRAHGRATTIRKRTSHIEITLGVKPGAEKKVSKKKVTKKEDIKVVNPEDVKKESPKVSSSGSDDQKKDEKGFLKGMFRRKTG